MSIIERVAQAIYESEENVLGEGSGDCAGWAGATELWKSQYRQHARLAIAAMRDPTRDQVSKATLSFPPWGGHGEASAPSTEDMWRALIDAALSEPKN